MRVGEKIGFRHVEINIRDACYSGLCWVGLVFLAMGVLKVDDPDLHLLPAVFNLEDLD